MTRSPRRREAIVRDVRDVAIDVRRIEFEPLDGDARREAGDHVDVEVTIDGVAATRSYSLIPAASGRLAIAVKHEREGRGGSAATSRLEVGDRLFFEGPANDFPALFDPRDTLLVAGGIGVTALIGHAEALARRGLRFRFLQAGRSRAHMAFLDELSARLGEAHEVFAADEGRRIDLSAEIARLAPDGRVWFCGPQRLREGIEAAWRAAGRPPHDLRFENFGAGGEDAAPFRVAVPRHGVEITVTPGTTLLDALEGAGLDLMSDCRRGECGLCALDVVSVEGRIDHRDVFFSEHEKAEGTKICPCVSRVGDGGRIVLDTNWRPDAI